MADLFYMICLLESTIFLKNSLFTIAVQNKFNPAKCRLFLGELNAYTITPIEDRNTGTRRQKSEKISACKRYACAPLGPAPLWKRFAKAVSFPLEALPLEAKPQEAAPKESLWENTVHACDNKESYRRLAGFSG